MDKLFLSDWVGVISAVGVIVSIIVSLSALLQKSRGRAANDAELKFDVKHIREIVDDSSAQLRLLNTRMDSVDVGLVSVRESCKSAHKRIDAITRRERYS